MHKSLQFMKKWYKLICSLAICLVVIPLIVWLGISVFGDRRFYLISLFIMLFAMIPFFIIFEKKESKTKSLLLIAVLSSLAVIGRLAFLFLPQFKPMAAIVIIAGVSLGAEAGFMVGAISAFVSNFFVGQGPWTPVQMFCFGMLGFLAGILYKKAHFKVSRTSLSIYGALSVFLIYGGIINISSFLLYYSDLSLELFFGYYTASLPMDLIHAASTAVFLFLMAHPILFELDRIKQKYGLLDNH